MMAKIIDDNTFCPVEKAALCEKRINDLTVVIQDEQHLPCNGIIFSI